MKLTALLRAPAPAAGRTPAGAGPLPPEGEVVRLLVGGQGPAEGAATPTATEVTVRVVAIHRDGDGCARAVVIIPAGGEDEDAVDGAPPDAPDLPDPPELSGLAGHLSDVHDLLWSTARDLVVLPVRVAPAGSGEWVLTPAGESRRVQRRQYVRVRADIAAVLQVLPLPGAEPDLPDEQPEPIDGRIVDLSEGGVRCVVPGPGPAEGRELVLSFDDDEGNRLHAPAVVVRRTDLWGARGRVSVALRFLRPELNEDAVRRMVFAEQLRVLRWRRALEG